MSNKRRTPSIKWVAPLLIVIIVLGFILYVISFGAISVNEEDTVLPNEFKEKRNLVKERHKKLKKLIEKQVSLEAKLNKWFVRIYGGVRFLFILLWACAIYLGYEFKIIMNLEDALNYSEAGLLVVFVFNFLRFGSLTNLKNLIASIKMRVENLIYRKYGNLSVKIQANKEQLAVIENDDFVD